MGNIAGIVLDQNHSPLSNTPVTLVGTDQSKVVITSSNGEFSFNGLIDGDYRLIAVHNEFNTASQRSITI